MRFIVLFIFSFYFLTFMANAYYQPKAMYNASLFEGDILDSSYPKPLSIYSAITDSQYLWPEGAIVYYIDPSLYSWRNLIKISMRYITSVTGNCVTFKERTFEPDYIHMFLGQGCYSNVGKQGGPQYISLGHGCHAQGVIIHELLHALGIYHHHSRSDRDEYLNIQYENIDPSAYVQFAKLNPWDNILFVPFDYESIMMYGETAFSRDGYSVTMKPNDPTLTVTLRDPGFKYGLTQSDIKTIQMLYSCEVKIPFTYLLHHNHHKEQQLRVDIADDKINQISTSTKR